MVFRNDIDVEIGRNLMTPISQGVRGAALLGAIALVLTLSSAPAAAETPPPPPPPGQLALTGDVSVHDPTMAFDEASGLYIVAATHNSIRTAPSMNGPWTNVGSVARADWTLGVPNSSTLWAPHLEKIGDTFYYYYSQSSFGSSSSAIGVKTTKTPAIPSSYVDLGRPIVKSGALADTPPSINYNAIDPDVVQDADGEWWLTWGSFWDGIVVQKLAPDLVSVVGEPTLVASRRADDNPVEGPAIFARDGYYYLVVSWDKCCAAATSTYKLAVGRSTSITGPYLDQDGVRLDEGGGTVILDTRQSAPGVTPAGLYRAPGGADTYSERGVDYLVYHSYLPNNTLGIRPFEWRDGWPSFSEASGSYNHPDGSYIRLVSEAKNFTMPAIGRVAAPTPAFGTAVQLNGPSPLSYIDMPDGIVSTLNGDFTISMWVKRGTTSSANNWARLFDFGDTTANFMYLTPASAAAPTGLRFDEVTPSHGSGTIPGSGNSVSVSTAWTHVAVTASGTTGTLWVNGQAVRTNTNFTVRPADLGFTRNNWIGRSQFSADPGLNASIDDFNIFSRALSASEMLAMTTTPGGGAAIGGGDVAWYRFDEAGGSQVTDSSASGNVAKAIVPVTTADQLQNPVRGTQCLTAAEVGVIQAACADGDAAQTWRLDEAEGGSYTLANHATSDSKCLALANGTGAVGTAAVLADCSPSDGLQRWTVEDTGHGFLRFANPQTRLAVEISNDDGAIQTGVVGAVRAIRPIANLDPPQQWFLEHVKATPKISLAPAADVTAEVGESVTLSASAAGSPAPTVQWETSADRGATWTPVSDAVGDDYTFTATAEQDGSLIRATYTNEVGSASTEPTSITITRAALIAPTGLVIRGSGVVVKDATSYAPGPFTLEWTSTSPRGSLDGFVVLDGGQQIGASLSPSARSVDLALPEGNHSLQVMAVAVDDLVIGGDKKSELQSVVVDRTAPVVAILTPSNPTRSTSWTSVSGTITDAASGPESVTVKLVQQRGNSYYAYDGRSWTKASSLGNANATATAIHPTITDGAWSVRISDLKTGTLMITYSGTDAVGNTGVPTGISFAVN